MCTLPIYCERLHQRATAAVSSDGFDCLDRCDHSSSCELREGWILQPRGGVRDDAHSQRLIGKELSGPWTRQCGTRELPQNRAEEGLHRSMVAATETSIVSSIVNASRSRAFLCTRIYFRRWQRLCSSTVGECFCGAAATSLTLIRDPRPVLRLLCVWVEHAAGLAERRSVMRTLLLRACRFALCRCFLTFALQAAESILSHQLKQQLDAAGKLLLLESRGRAAFAKFWSTTRRLGVHRRGWGPLLQRACNWSCRRQRCNSFVAWHRACLHTLARVRGTEMLSKRRLRRAFRRMRRHRQITEISRSLDARVAEIQNRFRRRQTFLTFFQWRQALLTCLPAGTRPLGRLQLHSQDVASVVELQNLLKALKTGVVA